MQYVAHLGAIDGQDAVNSQVKATMATHLKPKAMGFNPCGAWQTPEIASLRHTLSEPLAKRARARRHDGRVLRGADVQARHAEESDGRVGLRRRAVGPVADLEELFNKLR